MHETDFVQTVCWETRAFAVGNQSRGWNETVSRFN